MAESQVLNGLVAKRGELAGEMAHHRRELQRLAELLGHVDATIRLFDANYAVDSVAARQHRHRQQYFGPGECQRLVLEVLRDAPEPLPGRALAQAVMARKGIEERREVLAVVQKTALAVLRRLVCKGAARRQVLANGTSVWARG